MPKAKYEKYNRFDYSMQSMPYKAYLKSFENFKDNVFFYRIIVC